MAIFQTTCASTNLEFFHVKLFFFPGAKWCPDVGCVDKKLKLNEATEGKLH